MESSTLYSILGVEAQASAEDVRKAYRKLALKWHPGEFNYLIFCSSLLISIYCKKNMLALYADKQRPDSDQQLSLEKFREVTNAYEILSDEKERQWYDSRLRRLQKCSASGKTFGRHAPPDLYSEIAKVLVEREYINGHFSFDNYVPLFQKIASLEGGGYPNYEESPVQVFYAEWGSFATTLDFAWVADAFDTQMRTCDRRIRRMIEQENVKARKIARKEYNESVREFSEFVKRRDPKYEQWKLVCLKEKEQREKERKAREKKKEQRKKGTVLSDLPPSNIVIEEQEEFHNVWYCPACEKYFKSSGSFNSHEKSKKHTKNVELMKQMLLLDEYDFDADISGADSNNKSEKEEACNPQSTAEDSAAPLEQSDSLAFDASLLDKQEKGSTNEKITKKKKRTKSSKKQINSRTMCQVCKVEFSSRNQLFDHIKEAGHACSRST